MMWLKVQSATVTRSTAQSTAGSSLQRYTSDHGGAWPFHVLYLPNLSGHVWSHCSVERSSQSTWQLGSSSQGPEQRIKSDATIWPSLPTLEKSHKSICFSHVSSLLHPKLLDGQVQASGRENVSTLRPFKEGECLSNGETWRHGGCCKMTQDV